MAAGIAARLRGFDREETGQILPLVLAFAIAFFTGTVLVMNTGRAVNDRIQAQNAVDAAVLSGTTTIARGMNYVARNNVQIAKTLATIVIVRALPPAIEAALKTLQVWETVVIPAMLSAASALMAGTFTYPAGLALQITAYVLRVKVKIEQALLKVLKPLAKQAKKQWDNDGNGVGWKLAKALSTLGTVLVYATPAIAQFISTRVVYKYDAPLRDEDRGMARRRNQLPWEMVLPTFDNPQAWMIPLFPNLPACKGKFGHFLKPTEHYVEYYADPIITGGWILLTLSGFPIYFEGLLKSELKYMFEGGSPPGEPGVDPTRMNRIRELTDENTALEAEIRQLEAQIEQLDDGIDDLLIELEGQDAANDLQASISQLEAQRADKVAERQQAAAKRDQATDPDEKQKFQEQVDKLTGQIEHLDDRIATKQAKKDGLGPGDKGLKKLKQEALAKRDTYPVGSDEWNAWNDKVTKYDQRIHEIEGFPPLQKGEIQHKRDLIALKRAKQEQKQDKITKNNEEIEKLTKPPEGEGGADMGGAVDSGNVKDKPGYFPYLIDAGADPSKDWKAKATYYAFGWYNPRTPLVTGESELFGAGRTQKLFSQRWQVAVVYAAARIYNPTRADLWYPDWRAKLVRVQASLLSSRNPIGGTVKKCGTNQSVSDPTNSSTPNGQNQENASSWKDTLDKLIGELSLH